MASNLLTAEEIALLNAFNALSNKGQKIYLQFMARLLELPEEKTQDDIDRLVAEYQRKLFAV